MPVQHLRRNAWRTGIVVIQAPFSGSVAPSRMRFVSHLKEVDDEFLLHDTVANPYLPPLGCCSPCVPDLAATANNSVTQYL